MLVFKRLKQDHLFQASLCYIVSLRPSLDYIIRSRNNIGTSPQQNVSHLSTQGNFMVIVRKLMMPRKGSKGPTTGLQMTLANHLYLLASVTLASLTKNFEDWLVMGITSGIWKTPSSCAMNSHVEGRI